MGTSRAIALTKMHANTLAWLASNSHDYDTLAAGPLGEALTRDELRDLVDNPESMPRFIEGVRQTVGDLLDGEGKATKAERGAFLAGEGHLTFAELEKWAEEFGATPDRHQPETRRSQ